MFWDMDNSVQELIDMLYSMIQEAWGLPLGAEKCVIERDKALDLIDEIKAQLPGEMAEAKRLVAARTEFVNNAKREAESIRKVAEDRARQLVDEQEIVRSAKEKANSIISSAESKSAELRQVANQYADDTLLRTEEAINEALNEVRGARGRFRSLSGTGETTKNIVPDIDV
jgi:cell division septum initiation protein DivIVA